MNSLIGQVLALLTAGCWAQNSVVYGLAGKRVGSATVTHVRLWIAFPVILAVHLFSYGSLLPSGLGSPAWIYLATSGFAGFFLADLLLFQAFVDIGHRKSLVIFTLSPIAAAALSWWLLDESLGLIQITGILVTLAGIAVVVFLEGGNDDEDGNSVRGVLFAVLGSLFQAAGMVLAKFGLSSDVPPISANVIRIAAGLSGLTLFSLVRKQFTTDFRKMKDIRSLIYISSGAVLGPVLGIILTLYAFNYAPTGIVTTIVQTSPILLLPVDHFLFRKKIVPGAVIGTVIAVAGAVLLFLEV